LTNSHDSHVKNKLFESGIKHHQTPVRPKGMTIGVVGLAKQKGPHYFSMCNFLWGSNKTCILFNDFKTEIILSTFQ
jgi:hypothetical protein